MDTAIAFGLLVYVAIAAVFLVNCIVEAETRPRPLVFLGLALLSAIWPLALAGVAIFVLATRRARRRGASRGR